METKSVTYFPESAVYVAGEHKAMPAGASLLASTKMVGEPGKQKLQTSLIDAKIHRLAASIANNKMQILAGQLSAADYDAARDNLEHLILVRLYNQLMGEQMKWFHLDEMFNGINIDKLQMRMSFKDNPAAAQKVGRREQYDVSKVNYDEIQFDLPKHVVSYDIALEDPLRALISPVIPLQQTNDYSMAYLREQSALDALKNIKYHYTKDASGSAKFEATTAPADSAAKRISNPSKLTGGNVHSDNKPVDEVQDMVNDFMQQYDIILTHFACSPKTATKIAGNTWTQPNTIMNVEAYRTSGGVRPFPGLSDKTMVISQLVPDNILYAASKPQNVLVKAEGPKITKTWEDNSRFVTQTATADFFQYKCAHEDLSKIKSLIECYLSQDTNDGKFYRCRIKNAVKILDDRHGLILSLTGEGVEVRLKETPVSNPQRAKTPAYAITQYMTEYNSIVAKVTGSFQEKLYGFGAITGGNVVTSPDSTVLLDDSASLKQNWILSGITNYYDVFDDIIQKLLLAQPQGGTNIEYFMDYDYPNNVFADGDKKWIKVIAKIFGDEDSGISITPISFDNPESDSTEIVNNQTYYDGVMLECADGYGSLPMDRTRYFSKLEHARYRDKFVVGKSYNAGELVKYTDTAKKTVRFYKVKKAFDPNKSGSISYTPPSGASPASDTYWEEDIYKSNNYSPLTNNLELWKANLSAYKNSDLGSSFTETVTKVSAGSGYIGGFVDPNFVRANADYGDLDHYHTISVKDVVRIITANAGIPTGAEIYDGIRILVGQDKNAAISTAPFSANKQRLAEYDGVEKSWKFSKTPEDGDVISDHATLRFYKYEGTYPDGSWKIMTKITDATWKTMPFHPVKEMSLKPDIYGNQNAAVEFLFDWNTNPVTGGTYTNAYSRGWWITFYHPTPRFHISPQYGIGSIFSEPFLDTANMAFSQHGDIGYNGLHGEDLGGIQGIRFTLTPNVRDSNNNSLDFKANQKVTLWVLDKFGRIHYADEEHRANGKPDTYVVAFGLGAGQNLWFNRVDDLEQVYGLTIPAFFGLEQEERSGMVFDWNWVKAWGVMSGEPYNTEPRYYTGGANSYIEDLVGRLNVVKEYLINSTQSLFKAPELGPAVVLADNATVRIEDLHYIKKLVASSENSALVNPHFRARQDSFETDYNNAKLTARSIAAKGKAFRPIRHITSDLDVRLRKGQKFTTSDGREWVASEVKQIVNDDGATMEIAAIPKLIIGV